MVTVVVTILHVVVSVFLILVVLLQTGKGADMGAAFGGGASQTLFGSRRGDVMTKVTTIAAVTFMVTTVLLTYFATTRGSVVREAGQLETAQPVAPAETMIEEEAVPAEEGMMTEEPGAQEAAPAAEEAPSEEAQ